MEVRRRASRLSCRPAVRPLIRFALPVTALRTRCIILYNSMDKPDLSLTTDR